MDAARKLEYAYLLDIKNRNAKDAINHFEPYDKQQLFIDMTAKSPTSYLSACNGAGKTEVGATIDTHIITGVYPDNYTGYRTDKCLSVWIGSTNPDLLVQGIQEKLFCAGGFDVIKDKLADKDSTWTGKIPKRLVLDISRDANTSFVKTALVQHVSGEVCDVRFFHYALQPKRIAGKHPVQWVHCDEIPPLKIWNELIARQRTTDDGIKAIITATPEFDADQEMINRLFEEEWTQDGNSRMTIPIDDVPDWIISKANKEQAKRETAPALAPAKLYGEPVFGAKFFGRIKPEDIRISRGEFETALESRPFASISGMDFGFNDAMAHVTLHIDVGNGDCFLSRTVKETEMTAAEFCNNLRTTGVDLTVPTGWPHDGMVRTKREDKKPFIHSFRDYGLNCLSEHVKKPVKESNKHSFWWDIEQKAIEKKFFIVEGGGNHQIEEEWRKLRLGDDGRVVGEDHALDGLACAWQSRPFAKMLYTAPAVADPAVLSVQRAQNLGIPAHLLT